MNTSNRHCRQLLAHGEAKLPNVVIDSYNLEIEDDDDGFLGDKASKAAFWDILDRSRKLFAEVGDDPLGKKTSENLGKNKLATVLAEGGFQAAGLVQSAVEDFAQELSRVIRRFLKEKEWRRTECLMIGGGFRGSRLGELVVGRSAVILKSKGVQIDLELIRNSPDEAGLIGTAYLLPNWMLKGYGGMLAVDIGGTNIRVGIVQLKFSKSGALRNVSIAKSELWRHVEDAATRDSIVSALIRMLRKLVSWAKDNKLTLAPVVGIGCPGVIREDGAIARGTQNLPGDWANGAFILPDLVRDGVPCINGHETVVVMHNDAVVQGLSELPQAASRMHWGILTVGTGLGNARFTNRHVKTGKVKR